MTLRGMASPAHSAVSGTRARRQRSTARSAPVQSGEIVDVVVALVLVTVVDGASVVELDGATVVGLVELVVPRPVVVDVELDTVSVVDGPVVVVVGSGAVEVVAVVVVVDGRVVLVEVVVEVDVVATVVVVVGGGDTRRKTPPVCVPA